ncbi:MAG TPA: ATP-binding protein [Phycisphaerae bacterium]|nr:ATP-binding protein [Phycisphaerae bacterium]HRW55116.1 ATP-binding protein [Phycisphaerae bacterium]
MGNTDKPEVDPTPPAVVADDVYLRHVCEGLGFICTGLDTSGRIIFWNQAAQSWFGGTPEERIGGSFFDLLSAKDRPKARRLCDKVVDTGVMREMEAKYPSEDSDPTTLVLILSPVMDDAGQCVGVSASMRDISARKRLSRELGNARRIAALGRMAGGVAHHFNNILGGMLTSIDYVLASDSPRELRKTLRLLSQAIGRATRITNQLAAFAESENAIIEWASLEHIVDEFLHRIRSKAALKGIRVVDDIEHVSTEPFEMQRLMPVLESVAQNSLDAMTTGGELRVSLSVSEEWAVITISDTGCGIPKDVMDRVFEPFFTTKGELGGGSGDNIGLGMAAVHGLVGEMDGTIRLASQIGSGTQVTISLPLHRPEK